MGGARSPTGSAVGGRGRGRATFLAEKKTTDPPFLQNIKATAQGSYNRRHSAMAIIKRTPGQRQQVHHCDYRLGAAKELFKNRTIIAMDIRHEVSLPANLDTFRLIEAIRIITGIIRRPKRLLRRDLLDGRFQMDALSFTHQAHYQGV